MSTATIKPTPIARRAIEDFPDFDLAKLLGTVFDPIQGCRVAILIDLADTSQMQLRRSLPHVLDPEDWRTR